MPGHVGSSLIEFGVGVDSSMTTSGPYSSRNRLALLVLKLRYVTFIVPTSTSLATRFLTPSLRQASPTVRSKDAVRITSSDSGWYQG